MFEEQRYYDTSDSIGTPDNPVKPVRAAQLLLQNLDGYKTAYKVYLRAEPEGHAITVAHDPEFHLTIYDVSGDLNDIAEYVDHPTTIFANVLQDAGFRVSSGFREQQCRPGLTNQCYANALLIYRRLTSSRAR